MYQHPGGVPRDLTNAMYKQLTTMIYTGITVQKQWQAYNSTIFHA